MKTNTNIAISELVFGLYEDNLFTIAEANQKLQDAGVDITNIEQTVNHEFEERFCNNPKRIKRYKKYYR